MRRLLTSAFATLSLAFALGCGGGEEAANTLPAAGTIPTDPIAKVVYDFLDTVRKGPAAEAHQYLTPLALERITALDMTIAPPGTPASSFQVQGVKERAGDRAVVAVRWSDVEDGKPYHENIFFELRQVEAGWRICAMGQDMGAGRAPMVMNFEAPPTTAPANVAATQAPGAVAPGAVTPATAMQPGPGALPTAPATIGAAPLAPPTGLMAPPQTPNPQVAQDPNQPRYQ